MLKNFFYIFQFLVKNVWYIFSISKFIFFLKGFNKSFFFFLKSFMKQKRKTKIGLKNKEHQPTTEPNLFFGIFVVFFY